jgi:hypothetical protein
MPTFEVQSHEVTMTSATSGAYAPRIQLHSTCATTAAVTRIWLYFEPVPALYASKGGIGFGKTSDTSAKYWTYLDQATFDEVSAAVEGGGRVNVNVEERSHPGAAGANRLVTDMELAFAPEGLGAERQGAVIFPAACSVLFAAV